MTDTLTGDDNYSGTYSNVDVLGAASAGGGTFTDTNLYANLAPSGPEVFLFGDLQFRSNVVSSGDVTSGTYNTTGTGSAGDTMVFDFTFDPGHTGGAPNFLT